MVSEEKNKLEEKFSALEAAHLLSQDQSNQLQVGNVPICSYLFYILSMEWF